MESQMNTREIFVRHTDCAGKSWNSSHFVWDAARFMAARQTEAANLNEKQKPGDPRKARADQITAEQFNKERTPRS